MHLSVNLLMVNLVRSFDSDQGLFILKVFVQIKLYHHNNHRCIRQELCFCKFICNINIYKKASGLLVNNYETVDRVSTTNNKSCCFRV